MKKKLTLLIVLVLSLCLVFTLASCGENSDTDTNTETETENGNNTDTSTDNSADTETDTETDTGTNTDTDTDEPEHVHVEETIPAIEPTCTETGLTEGKKCSVCDEILVEQEIIPAKHTYDGSYECTKCDFVLPTSQGLVFTLNTETDTYKVSGLSNYNTDTDIVIPYTYEGKAVTSIGSSAFYGCTSLTSITIPDSVTSIGSSAFDYCYKLVEVYNLSSLNITVGSSGNGYVGYYAKAVHTSLDEESILKTTDDGYVFAVVGENEVYLVDYIGDETELTLPESYNGNDYEINKFAFYKRNNITKVTIPNSVISIGISAFDGCPIENATMPTNAISYIPKSNLKTVVINGGASIGSYAFYNCSSLTSITILDSVTSIGTYAFAFCASLTSITIPDSVTSIGDSAFYYCENLTSVTIGNGVTSIGRDAFRDCTSLTSVTIPDSVTSIGTSAFNGCTALTEINFNAVAMDDLSSDNYVFYNAGKNGDGIKVTIGKNVTKIPAYLFYPYYNSSYLPKITSVLFEEGSVYESIGSYAFYGCTALTSIVIPDSVTSIGDSAFYHCENLTSVTIGNGVTSIGDEAFRSCKKLTSVTIPDSVTSIGSSAFDYCYKLVEVYNLSSLNITVGSSGNGYVGYYAKAVHTSLDEESILKTTDDGYVFAVVGENEVYLVDYIGDETELTLPESYNGNDYEIYQCAFYKRNDITKVTIPDSVTSIGDFAFGYCDSLTSVTIPDSVTSIGYEAFFSCENLTSITIPDSVTSIGDRAFCSCKKLTSVTIGNGVTSIGSSTFQNCPKLVEVYNLSSLNITAGSSGNGYVGYYAKAVHTSLEDTSILETVNDYIFMTWEDKYYLIGYVGNDTELTLPESYNGNDYEIYEFAFYECDSLKYNEYDNACYLGNEDNPYLVLVKAKDTSITSCTINENTKIIYSNAFQNCISLASITIPNSVTSIGTYAFAYCASLTSITIPDSVTSIGYDAFRDCTSLTSVTIPDSVTSIGDEAFYGCNSLTIYCEATEQPSGWYSSWSSSNRPVYWYSEEEPTSEGNYWHYVDGVVTIWE